MISGQSSIFCISDNIIIYLSGCNDWNSLRATKQATAAVIHKKNAFWHSRLLAAWENSLDSFEYLRESFS